MKDVTFKMGYVLAFLNVRKIYINRIIKDFKILHYFKLLKSDTPYSFAYILAS